MHSKEVEHQVLRLQQIAIGTIGICCFCYTVFWVNFAKLHVTLPVVHIPIFIGEWLLAFCIVLMVRQWQLLRPKQLDMRHYVFMAYAAFVISKTAMGCIQFSPLSLRNAALFYYPFFVVIGFYCWRKEFFNRNNCLILLAVLLVTKLLGKMNGFFLFPYCALSVILLLRAPKWQWRAGLALAVVLLFPPLGFFEDSKAIVLGNLAAFLFLLVLSLYMLPLVRKYRIWVVIALVGVLGIAVVKLFGPNRVKSLSTPLQLMEIIKEKDNFIEQRKADYIEVPLEAHLYHDPLKKKNVKPFEIITTSRVIAPTPQQVREVSLQTFCSPRVDKGRRVVGGLR